MSRIANLRRRPLGIARLPRRSRYGGDPLAEPEPFMGPSPDEGGSILPFWQATELLRYLKIMGPDGDAHCRHALLDAPKLHPEFETEADVGLPVPFCADRRRGVAVAPIKTVANVPVIVRNAWGSDEKNSYSHAIDFIISLPSTASGLNPGQAVCSTATAASRTGGQP